MGEQVKVFVGDAEVGLEEAFNLCGGCLLCQASSRHAHALLDFARDYGIIAPELFLRRLQADALSESTKLLSPEGAQVRLSSKRVSARSRRPRRAPAVQT